MKKKLFYLLFGLLIIPTKVLAVGNLNVAGSVEVGSSVSATFTVSGVAAWDIDINSSGSTSGCSQHFVDSTSNGKNTTKSFTVKCKATSLGTIAFTVSGDVTSESGNKSDVSISKRVTVTPVREKSSDATLSSLKVDGYELTPAFNKDTLEYSVDVPATVEKIKIDAKQNESHATLEGVGEFDVVEGLNPFKIVVTSETNTTKTYTINVNVKDENPIIVNIGNKEYTLIKNAKNLEKPEFYEEVSLTIENVTIPAFKNEITNFTLVGVKDSENNIYFAIYDENTNKYTLYNEIKSSILNLYLVDFTEELKNMIKSTVNINGEEYPVYKTKDDSRFVICYAMDITTGKYDYYSYDTINETFQVWSHDVVDIQNEANIYLYTSIIFASILFISFILNIILLKNKNHKKKKNNNKKDNDSNKKESKEELKELFKEYDDKKEDKYSNSKRFDFDEKEE